jgi:hypothetical protein
MMYDNEKTTPARWSVKTVALTEVNLTRKGEVQPCCMSMQMRGEYDDQEKQCCKDCAGTKEGEEDQAKCFALIGNRVERYQNVLVSWVSA